MSVPRQRGRTRRLVQALAIATGIVLVIIGIRFFTVPSAAIRFFGVGGPDAHPNALAHVIAARDVWLGLLAVALAVFREWRALALWLALGTLVCFADAAIVAASSGPLRSIAFHVASGVFCAGLAAACWRHSRADDSR